MGLKPGPKPVAKSTGKEDKRQRAAPESKSKHPVLKDRGHKGLQISFDSADHLAEEVAALKESGK
ncbi:MULTISPECIES: hypothetical protein [Enterobacterales]|uniref:hypothetical protein n=1 Tax=Enterobacterales TaxID=91347 RepID=UPI0005AD23B5|nr:MULTISPECIES: hypothetical protein [Enterobacterales]AJJ07884.1 hypothetical protein BZ20_868 [Yersinia pseudotuberculosis]MBO1562400.1 hypothetical protein [Yersinia pseudotuberculosis]